MIADVTGVSERKKPGPEKGHKTGYGVVLDKERSRN
jgi:hypothetical protein